MKRHASYRTFSVLLSCAAVFMWMTTDTRGEVESTGTGIGYRAWYPEWDGGPGTHDFHNGQFHLLTIDHGLNVDGRDFLVALIGGIGDGWSHPVSDGDVDRIDALISVGTPVWGPMYLGLGYHYIDYESGTSEWSFHGPEVLVSARNALGESNFTLSGAVSVNPVLYYDFSLLSGDTDGTTWAWTYDIALNYDWDQWGVSGGWRSFNIERDSDDASRFTDERFQGVYAQIGCFF